MKFSVIVPVYNVERYLEQCIDSVLNQEFKDFELILVDDGSPDKCPQICDWYVKKDDRVKVIHKENGGLSDARNAGIHSATGDFLLFLDSDDYWNSTLVLKKIQFVLAEYDAEIVHFGRENFCIDKNQIVTGKNRTLSKYNGLEPWDTIDRLVKKGELTISACVMAVSRRLVVKNSLYFKKGIKTEDLEWAIRLYLCEPRWAFLDDYFYVYRYARDGSITSSIDYKHLCDYCWILEQSVARVESVRECMSSPLISYLMYHTLIVSALIYRVNLSNEQRSGLLSRLEVICKGRITSYTMNKKVKAASYIYRVGGFRVMTRALGFYLNNRGR